MAKILSILVGAAALALSLVALTGTAGASGHVHTGFAFTAKQQDNFIKAVHAWVRATKHEKSKDLITTGEAICNDLPVEDVHLIETQGPLGEDTLIETVSSVYNLFTNDNLVLGNREWSTANAADATNANDLFGMALLELCPSYEPDVKLANHAEGMDVPTTKTPPPPSIMVVKPIFIESNGTSCSPSDPTCTPPGWVPTVQDNQIYAAATSAADDSSPMANVSMFFVSDTAYSICTELSYYDHVPPGTNAVWNGVVDGLEDSLPQSDNGAVLDIMQAATTLVCPQYGNPVG